MTTVSRFGPATFCLFVLSILQCTIMNVSSFSRPSSDLLPFTNEADAKEYALFLCQTVMNYWSDDGKMKYPTTKTTFLDVWGSNGDLWDDFSVSQIDGKNAIVGYDDISYESQLARKLFTLSSTQSCNDIIDNEGFDYQNNWVQYKCAVTYGMSGMEYVRETTAKWMFHPQRKTIQKYSVISGGNDAFLGSVVDLVDNILAASAASVDAASYLGLIQVGKGTEEKINMISKVFFVALILIGLLFAITTCLCINTMFKTKRIPTYKPVSITSDSEQEQE